MSGYPTGTGAEYNEKWGVGARQAYFHKGATFYMPLRKFPGAFFDPDGYILFKTERDYVDSSGISQATGPRANIRSGIKSLAAYTRCT